MDADSTVEDTSDDPWFFFAYDDMWRIVATYHEDDNPDAVPEEKPKEVFVYHCAGLDGGGGSSYIDSVILREKDANTDWDTASDGVLEERLYYCQNWRADVVVLMTVNGDVAEFVKYSAYGEPFLIPAGDVNSSGATDGQDFTDFGNVLNTTYPYDVRCDLAFDGTIDTTDYFALGAHYSAGYNSGRGEVSRSDLANRKAYAGYENDGNLTRFYHVRFRVLDTLLGRWTRRDPLGYVDGANLYGVVAGRPIIRTDALGLGPPPHPGEVFSCEERITLFIFWTYQFPRCHLVPSNPGSQPIPGDPFSRYPSVHIVCDPPTEQERTCEDAARQAGLDCCRTGGDYVDCVVATRNAYNGCMNPPPPPTPPSNWREPFQLPDGLPDGVPPLPSFHGQPCEEGCFLIYQWGGIFCQFLPGHLQITCQANLRTGLITCLECCRGAGNSFKNSQGCWKAYLDSLLLTGRLPPVTSPPPPTPGAPSSPSTPSGGCCATF